MAHRVVLTGGGTGGHLVPALNLARALRRREPEVEILYLGARRGVEAEELPGRGLRYRLLPAHPIYRSRAWRNWRLLATAPWALLGAARAFAAFDPQVVVGTGGYASGPGLAWALLTGRPVVLQEQNAEPGLVTRWLARWAAQVHLGFRQAEAFLSPGPRTRVFCHGNPVDPGSAKPGRDGPGDRSPDAGRTEDGSELRWPSGRVLLVAGGSQGARSVNRRLLEDLRGAESWPEGVAVVWIAGRAHAARVRGGLEGSGWEDRISVVPYVPDLARSLWRVSLALSRAGAMFVSELAAAGVPAVLVPFPGAAGGHQEANARVLERAGGAVVRRERDLRPGELWKVARSILADEERRSAMAAAARRVGAPDAAERIAADVLAAAGGRSGGSG